MNAIKALRLSALRLNAYREDGLHALIDKDASKSHCDAADKTAQNLDVPSMLDEANFLPEDVPVADPFGKSAAGKLKVPGELLWDLHESGPHDRQSLMEEIQNSPHLSDGVLSPAKTSEIFNQLVSDGFIKQTGNDEYDVEPQANPAQVGDGGQGEMWESDPYGEQATSDGYEDDSMSTQLDTGMLPQNPNPEPNFDVGGIEDQQDGDVGGDLLDDNSDLGTMDMSANVLDDQHEASDDDLLAAVVGAKHLITEDQLRALAREGQTIRDQQVPDQNTLDDLTAAEVEAANDEPDFMTALMDDGFEATDLDSQHNEIEQVLQVNTNVGEGAPALQATADDRVWQNNGFGAEIPEGFWLYSQAKDDIYGDAQKQPFHSLQQAQNALKSSPEGDGIVKVEDDGEAHFVNPDGSLGEWWQPSDNGGMHEGEDPGNPAWDGPDLSDPHDDY